jgi:Ribbon-helix-helix protein, copG family.
VKRENKKLLRLNDEENKMLMELCEKYSMGVNEMLRYLVRKEYERISQKTLTQ